jgi:hypothetical protein
MTEDIADPKLYADTRGVWREDKLGHPFGLEWHEICRISGYKSEDYSEVNTVLELDLVFGEFLELNSSWDGFDQIVAAICERIEGLQARRFKELEALTADDDAIIIWERA